MLCYCLVSLLEYNDCYGVPPEQQYKKQRDRIDLNRHYLHVKRQHIIQQVWYFQQLSISSVLIFQLWLTYCCPFPSLYCQLSLFLDSKRVQKSRRIVGVVSHHQFELISTDCAIELTACDKPTLAKCNELASMIALFHCGCALSRNMMN